MAEDSAQVVEVAAGLDEPRREGVPEVVPPHPDDLGPAAGGGEPLLRSFAAAYDFMTSKNLNCKKPNWIDLINRVA
jgi:hypothetical protein